MVKILFVDNSRTTRATMSRLLTKRNFDVETAGTGAEAIEVIKTRDDFNLIIMDLYMPLMNGHEAAKVIRSLPDEKKNKIPIIALTASSNKKDMLISKESGMNEFVVKSSDHQELYDALDKIKNKI